MNDKSETDRDKNEIRSENPLALEVECEYCGGTKYTFGRHGMPYACGGCDGKGRRVTEFGESVLDFVRRHITSAP